MSIASDVFNMQLWQNKIMREMTMSTAVAFQEDMKDPEPLRPFARMGNDNFNFEHESFIIQVKLSRYYTTERTEGKKETLSKLAGGEIKVYVHAPPPSSRFLASMTLPLIQEAVSIDPDSMLREALPYLMEKAKERVWDLLADGKTDTVRIIQRPR